VGGTRLATDISRERRFACARTRVFSGHRNSPPPIKVAKTGSRRSRRRPSLYCAPGSPKMTMGQPCPYFPNRRGRKLSRDAVEHRISYYTAEASHACPSLQNKKITAHVLRHTAAMQLLHAGVDSSVIALWLGHESVETTQIYLHADLVLKETSDCPNKTRELPAWQTQAARRYPCLARIALRLCRPPRHGTREGRRFLRPHRHNREVGIIAIMPISA
jgi:Phage integrase family